MMSVYNPKQNYEINAKIEFHFLFKHVEQRNIVFKS